MTRLFPQNFLFGAATSAHQVEGANTNSDWWHFERSGHTAPVEPSGDAIDHWHRYEQDFALLRSLGHNAHRLSVEWARIEPAPGEFSRAALQHYRRVLQSLKEHGLASFVTLHHFTLPQWLAEEGGWLSPRAIPLFRRYCERVSAELGDLATYICTINEPQMVALHGYLEGYFPPGQTNPTLWKRVGRVLLAAHHEAVDAVRSAGGQPSGLVVQVPFLSPAHQDPASVRFCHELRAEIIDLYLDELHPGDGGDWLGIQYYRRNWVDPALPTIFAPPPAEYETSQMGWATYPEGLLTALQRGAETGLPLFITENGIATEDDAQRIDYIEDHLEVVLDAIESGVDVRGYLHWSAFDNFEWAHGYRPRFGLISVDEEFVRHPKPSAYAFKRLAETRDLAALKTLCY